MSHTSTSPLYSPPAGPSGPGQELTHAQRPGLLANHPAPPPRIQKTILRGESQSPKAHCPAVPYPGTLLLPG